MRDVVTESNEFLCEISMHPDFTDIQAITELFVSEMEKGLRGECSSVPMIPTYISLHGKPPENVPVIAVDAGGTNLRVALVTFEKGKTTVSQMNVYPIPGSEHEISSDEFFLDIAKKILPLTDFSDRIGFCFSYPAEIFPDHDGKILRLSKGVFVREAEGRVLGHELKKSLIQLGAKKNFSFTLLNDTVASLLGGAAEFSTSDFDGICGLVLGTGFNTCYAEKGEKIVKLCNAEDMIINCESSSFTKEYRGIADEMTDAESENPGDGLFEKMIAGAYNGWVITNIAILATQKGILSDGFAEIEPRFSSPEVDDFIRGVDNRVAKMCVGTDSEVLRDIIDKSFERSAKLVCANIAALCLHCDGGKSPLRPFCIVAEGSTFYKSLLFREKLDKYVKSEIEDKLARFVVFKQTENATLTGAALAALLC